MSSQKKLSSYIQKLEYHISKYEVTNPKVSQASIGWHLDHSLKVINNVCIALQNSDPKAYKNNLTFLGKFFLILGKFPRGKAKAPKHVKPSEIITTADLISQIEAAIQNIKIISTLPKNAHFKHPMFGHINRNRVMRFLEVHTNHHLKIIRDILK
jgi:hypothetical protein